MTDASDGSSLGGSAWVPMILAQAKPAAGGGAGGGGIADSIFGSGMLFPLMLTLLLMYFLLMRPEQRKKKEMEKLLSELKANDHVVTIGGICGVVVSASKDSNYVTIRIDDKTGTKIRILRSAISRVGSLDEAAEEEAKEKK